MKAIILAAGKGERLKSVLNNLPKPMINIENKPILEHNINLCKKYNITDIYINLHHLPHTIMKYFGDGKKFGVNIKYSYENEILGTSGAVKNISNKDEYFKYNDFFVIYGDNYSNYDISKLITENVVNIALHYREDVSNSGVALINDNNYIEKFIEKPKNIKIDSNWVNAGIYYLKPEILKFIPDDYSDFSHDIFPKLLENEISIYGVKYKDELKYFDTPESLYKHKNISF